MNKGAKIIAIEGCDGCGKETQSKLLKEHLESKGVHVKLISFPNYSSPSSELVKLFLAGKFQETTDFQRTTMYGLDRSLTMNRYDMKEFLKDPNNVLICDRYMSSLVYDTEHNEDHELLRRFEEIFHIEHDILKVPKPDIMIFMNLDDEHNNKIIEERKSMSEADIYEADNSFLARIRKNIRRISKCSILQKTYNIVPLDCNDGNRRFTIEEVTDKLIDIVNKTLEVK